MHITAVVGPMFSGKTSKVDQILSIYSVLNKRCLYLTHSIDDRFDDDRSHIDHYSQLTHSRATEDVGQHVLAIDDDHSRVNSSSTEVFDGVSTHRGFVVRRDVSGARVERIKCSSLMSVEWDEIFDRVDVVVIDEAQFFDDLETFVRSYLHVKSVKMVICGLLSDSKLDRFGHIADIIHLCSDIIPLKSYCTKCNNDLDIMRESSFTARSIERTEQVYIGGTSEYYSVCIEHHPHFIEASLLINVDE